MTYYSKLLEFSVPCRWCSAKKGKPCTDFYGNQYDGVIHRARKKDYAKDLSMLVPGTSPKESFIEHILK